jgi:DNA-directed RNA polymerase subunit L
MTEFKITNFENISEVDIQFVAEDWDHEYVNSLIRATLQHISTYGFRKDDVVFIENHTMLNNQILAHRISMLPLFNPEGRPLQEYEFILDVRNNTNNVINITTDNFEIKHKTNGTILSTEEIFPHDPITNDAILLVKLNPMRFNENINLRVEPVIGTGKMNSAFQCTSQASHKFIVDENRARSAFQEKISGRELTTEEIEKEKKRFDALEKNYYYYKNENGRANRILMMFEGIGNIPIVNIPVLAANAIISRIDTLKIELTKNTSKKIIFSKSQKHRNAVIMKMNDEDDTIGTILSHYIYVHYVEEEGAVSYVGCKRPHYLKNNIVLKVITADGEIEPVKAMMDQSLTQLKEMYSNFKTKYERAVSK